MSNWEQKAVVGLANALVKHIKYAGDGLTDSAQLIGIYGAAKKVAAIANTGSELAIHIMALADTRLGVIGYRPSTF
jgi:hypothetical protein